MRVPELIHELLGDAPDYSALAREFSADTSELREYYEHATSDLRCRIISVVAHMPGKEALQLLLSAGNASDEAERISAIVSMGAVTERSRVGKLKAFLEKCLQDDLASVRSAAVLSLHSSHKRAFHDLLETLAEKDPSAMVREAATQVLTVKTSEPEAEFASSLSAPGRVAKEIRSEFPNDPVSRIIAIDTPLPGVELGT
jgi:HEAT repeat protein